MKKKRYVKLRRFKWEVIPYSFITWVIGLVSSIYLFLISWIPIYNDLLLTKFFEFWSMGILGYKGTKCKPNSFFFKYVKYEIVEERKITKLKKVT